ncbi:protein ALP1-like isoform X2 [Sitophilus oryzae]|uniref:Protein ALP1-like isoform X2 n=1 Tax=Sitophilus oryzae TaxID=7048 RepID=A0A6J2YIK3_SITOR|nr:protein ALP1-like isoform X2 [Sitophilus oryzae]
MKIRRKVLKVIKVVNLAYLFLTLAGSVATLAEVHANRRRHRRWGIRPINKKKESEGLFSTLFKDMWKFDAEQFFKYTRMTQNQFKELLALIGKDIQKDKKRRHISPQERLLITLHYLAEGCSMQEMAWNFRIGKATVHTIIKETCTVLWKRLRPIVLPQPTKKHFIKIEKEFFKRWNIPNCIGAVDGKHINIIAPKHSGSAFFNYKKNFSIILMATCDAYYRFSMVDIGGAGAHHDSAIFRASCLGARLLDGTLDIPKPKSLPKTRIEIPHFLIGDAAFPLHENILRPYPGTSLNEKQTIFNYRLSRGRRCIENTFGILSSRWRILRKSICASLEICELIAQATVVLHNFLQKSELDIPPNERRYCPTGFVDYLDRDGNIHEGLWRNEGASLSCRIFCL